MSISTGICNFYRDVVAPVTITVPLTKTINLNSQSSFKKIPLSRLDFSAGAGLATFFLVQKIAQSIFFLAGTVGTLGLHKGMRTSLFKNAKEGLVYAGAIPLGIVGIFFPQTINQKVLQIPSQGLTTSFSTVGK